MNLACRARRIGAMAMARVDDTLTQYGAEGAAELRMVKHPSWTDEEIAADIARHYQPRRAHQVELALEFGSIA